MRLSVSLEDPAPCFRKGTALPGGMPRTLIVLGAARGGTSMIAQLLHDLGIHMGQALDSTYQDAAMSEISRALFDGRIDADHPAIEQVLRSRDRQFDVWGWKFPEHLFEKLYVKARSPHVIVVFRDPVAIATRESVSRGYNVEACLERALRQLSTFGQFVLATPYPCLGVSYERGITRKAELVDALADFAGIKAAQEVRQKAASRAQPGSSRYLSDTRANDIEGNIDCVDAHIEGWLRYPHQPGRKVDFMLLIDDVPIYQGIADRFRADLQKAFNNDGCCAFSIPTPNYLMDGRRHRVCIKISTDDSYAIDNNDRDWMIVGK